MHLTCGVCDGHAEAAVAVVVGSKQRLLLHKSQVRKLLLSPSPILLPQHVFIHVASL